jgi:hypothetical protein
MNASIKTFPGESGRRTPHDNKNKKSPASRRAFSELNI